MKVTTVFRVKSTTELIYDMPSVAMLRIGRDGRCARQGGRRAPIFNRVLPFDLIKVPTKFESSMSKRSGVIVQTDGRTDGRTDRRKKSSHKVASAT